jgi:hypothetical protein
VNPGQHGHMRAFFVHTADALLPARIHELDEPHGA